MIHLLIYLRYLAVAGQLLMVFFVSRRPEWGIPVLPLLVIFAGLLVFNIVSQFWFSRRKDAGSRALVFQLCVDVAALTGLLFFSGGPANPFVSLYLVPVAVAAISLEILPMAGITVLSASLYTWLLTHHLQLPHVHGGDFESHVTGMWMNFLLSAVIMVVVLGRFMSIVRDQRRRLTQARERAMRDESLLAFGSLAAGTAHQLNTPLTTLGLLIDDWETSKERPSRNDIAMMREQLAHCRDHVRSLAALARRGAMGEPSIESAEGFVCSCIERWQLLRPAVEVQVESNTREVRLRVDPTLPQALINLFNNAADASAKTDDSGIEITIELRETWLVVNILDRGPGLSLNREAMQEETYGPGLGIGLLITNASIERSGGMVRQFPREGGGCVTQVELPVMEDA